MKKKTLWLIIGVLILLVSVFAAVFWQTLIVYLAPKVVLAGALKDCAEQLEARFASGPVSVLAGGLDPEGSNRIGLQLDTYNRLLGAVRYDLQVQTELNPRRILADGNVSFKNTRQNLSLYMDADFAALSSQGLLSDQFYGLTYDTFSRDIRSNKLVGMLIGEAVLTQWESAVHTLQDVMQREYPELPDIADMNPEPLIMGVLAMDVDVEQVRIDSGGEAVSYHVISFETNGEEIAAGLQYLNLEMGSIPAAEEVIRFSFWLHDRELYKLEMESDVRKLDIYWGDGAVSFLTEEDIYFSYYDGTRYTTCTIQTEQLENLYRETVTYVGKDRLQLSYDWTASTGKLVLGVDKKGERTDLSLTLKPLENGFSLETQDFGALMHLLTGAPDAADNPCIMTVTAGADFTTPEYKNFTDWSLEDLLILIGDFGKLLGLEV